MDDKELLIPEIRKLFENMNIQLLNNYHNEFYDDNNKYNKINLKNSRKWGTSRESEIDPIFIISKSLLKKFENGLLLLENKDYIYPGMRKSKLEELLKQGKLSYYIPQKYKHTLFFIINHIVSEREKSIIGNINSSKVRLNKKDVDEKFFISIIEIVGQFVSNIIPNTRYKRVRRTNILVGYILTFCGFFSTIDIYENRGIAKYQTYLNSLVDYHLDIHVEKREKAEKLENIEELSGQLKPNK